MWQKNDEFIVSEISAIHPLNTFWLVIHRLICFIVNALYLSNDHSQPQGYPILHIILKQRPVYNTGR